MVFKRYSPEKKNNNENERNRHFILYGKLEHDCTVFERQDFMPLPKSALNCDWYLRARHLT